MMDYHYSVLMSVYYKEKAENLRAAMDSIWCQSVPTDDFVLICDGPLNEELDSVIDEMKNIHKESLRIIRLEKNGGLGNALNIGNKECRHELVARMDSDDISRPNRCEKQLEAFRLNPTISICSGTVEEFSTTKDIIESKRVLPERQNEIINFAKKRNPFNHPCVMYKKSDVDAVGGYIDFYLLEDYYLWVRMLERGYSGYNIQEPLLWMRAGSDLYKRRAGWKYVLSQSALFKYMLETGFINHTQFFFSIIIRTLSSVLPNSLRAFIYGKALRQSPLESK